MKRLIIDGEKFGMLTVLHALPTSQPRYDSKFLCICDCGKEVVKWKDSLKNAKKNGRVSSCGCNTGKYNKGNRYQESAKIKIGERFNRLVIIDIEQMEYKGRKTGYKMICKCDCGNISKNIYADLVNEKVVSCGCYAKEQNSITGSKVGLNNSTKANNKYKWHYVKNGEIIYMRSGYEVMYAIVLDNKGLEWEYEPKCFKLEDGMRYTPDFYLPKINEWIEVKGRYKERDKIKHLKFIEQGNKLKVVFLEDIQKELPYSYAKFKKDWKTNHRVADTIIAESGLTNFSTAQNNSKTGVSYGI